MRTAALVLGIVGGVFGIIAGVLAMIVGGVGAAFEASDSGMIAGLGFAAVLLAVLGVVGGAVAPSHPRVSAVLQLTSGFGGFIAVSAFWLLSGPLLLVGALLATLGRKPRTAVA